MFERELGRGGMAIVYLVRDLRHDRRVALKVLPPELASAVSLERFLREIRMVARLVHPHILPVLDSGELDHMPYYTTPFVEGESLRAKLDREKQLSLECSLQIASQVADALSYAHGQGVIHRDIKPGNILLEAGHAVVSDFGLARALTAAGNESLTSSGLAIGTPAYMSPEQAAGGSEVDARADLYSLGCVLYEMLAGCPPFAGPTAQALLARHAVDPVPSLRTIRATVPETVERAILRALAKVPSDRHATAGEFAQALTILPGESSTRRVPLVRTLGRQSWRRVVAIAVILSVLGLALVVASGTFGAALNLVGAGGLRQHRAGVGALDPRHIAVLYFEPRRGQDSLAYLADGLTEELIHELSRVPTLQVISRNGVGPYQGKRIPPDSIAKALDVGTLVQGTVAQSAGRLRVSVALIDGSTGAELGSTAIERPHHEIFALQDDLAMEVAIFLRRRLGKEVEKKLAESRARAVHPRAWHLFQQAEELKRDSDELLVAGDTNGAAVRLASADSLLVLSEQVEPKWGRPSVARGRIAYSHLDLVGTFDKEHYDRWTTVGLTHAQRALRLEPHNAEALNLRGELRYYRWLLNLGRDSAESSQLLTGAEADLQAAVAADPTAASAWTLLSHLRMGQSQPTQAKLAALRAYEADPYLASVRQTLWRLFQTSLELEDAAESRRWCDEGRRRFPDYYRFTECQIWLYALKGQSLDLNQLEPLYRRYVELTPPTFRPFNEHYGRMLVAIALARAGLRDSADRVARRTRATTTIDETRELAQLEAIARTIMGETDEGLRLLGEYLAANPQFRVSAARDQTWWFRDLRKDPRYWALIKATPKRGIQ